MRYRVLGPLQVRAADQWISFGPTKWKVLLSVLLCAANQVVSSERLLAEVWGEEPPRSARKLLQGYISQLRRGLGDGKACALATHKWGYQAYGYQLQVRSEETDVQCFEQLFDHGRAALAAGNFRIARARLDEAVELWSGPPFMDVPPTPIMEAEIVRLEELRLQVMESRIEAQMHCGEEGTALTDLEALVVEHPLRERLNGQLMHALYRAGRQADALMVYRRLRKTLVDELGVEPSSPTQQLHQQILTADAVLLADGDDAGGRQIAGVAAPSASLQAPRAASALTGRDGELAVLMEKLDHGGDGQAAVVVIDGMAGAGKSVLAIEAANRLASRFPDGLLYLDLQGSTPGLAPLTASGALHRLLRVLDQGTAAPADPGEASAVLRARLAHMRLLLVLDNADDDEQVAPILPVGRRCASLITSRKMLATLDGATHMHLDTLSDQRAVALIGKLVGPDRVAAEPDAASMIARLCGGLPLALRIVGARLVARPGWSLRVFAERLADRRTRLDQLQVGKLAVRAAFEVGYQALESSDDPLDQMAASAFRAMGLLDESSIGVPVVATLLAQPPGVTEASLERLVDVRLVEEAGPGRYRLPGLLRLFAWEKAGSQRPLKMSELADDQAVIDLIEAARASRAGVASRT